MHHSPITSPLILCFDGGDAAAHLLAAGNLDTLLTTPTSAGIDVRAAVADFHEKYYRCVPDLHATGNSESCVHSHAVGMPFAWLQAVGVVRGTATSEG